MDNNIPIKMDKQVFLLQDIFLFECMSNIGIAGTNSSFISRFLRNLHSNFHSNYQFALPTRVDICTSSLTSSPAFDVIDFLMITNLQ